jgi:hypothetical protein
VTSQCDLAPLRAQSLGTPTASWACIMRDIRLFIAAHLILVAIAVVGSI